MPITIDGSGTITGLSAGGLPDSSITTADIANAAITAAKLDGAQSGSAPIYAARAWVNFNGTGTVAIRASGNVTSITDRGTGEYTINFTSAMSDANYSTVGIGGSSTTINGVTFEAPVRTAQTTSAVQITIVTHAGALIDVDYVTAAVFR